jgi:hypothetical protein
MMSNEAHAIMNLVILTSIDFDEIFRINRAIDCMDRINFFPYPAEYTMSIQLEKAESGFSDAVVNAIILLIDGEVVFS